MIGGRKHVVVILVVVKNWACLVNGDDDDDAVSLQQYVLPYLFYSVWTPIQ